MGEFQYITDTIFVFEDTIDIIFQDTDDFEWNVETTKTVTLSIAGYQIVLNQNRMDNFSSSGMHEAISIREWDEITIEFNNLDETEIYNFYAWWSYARLGNSFALAMHSDSDTNTALDDSAASGQKVIPLVSTTGFSMGNYCVIKAAADDNYEVIQIASIDAGVSVTAEDNLLNSYISGDIFRHINFWPTVIVKDSKLPFPTDGPEEDFSFSITLRETK